ncbi:hypothetical protein GCM10023340_27300 [Nocardioides marinquilinus]|uniref:phospholipase D n=1 Tax=Nocardioides marinquilinus TaxID=1210400 RepID=A0ABP9PQ96_9ACTN
MRPSTPAPRVRTALLVLALVAGVLAALAPAPSGASPATAPAAPIAYVAPVAASAEPGRPYTPVTRVWFNDPLGKERAKRRIFEHLIRSIDATPAGAVIRFAVLSFADRPMADALLRADRRGVEVKLVFAGDEVYKPMTRLQRALGKNPRRDSFAVLCDSSCRGERGQMHAKFFSFSRVGEARAVTMVGSNNITRHNSHDQWSDLYVRVGDKRYYDTFGAWFAQAKRDRPLRDPYVNREIGSHRVMITPVDLARHRDPLDDALDSVTCLTRAGAIDPDAPRPDTQVPTNLLLAQHAWNGARGKRLARRVAQMVRSGCTARVFYGQGVGPAVRRILTDGGAVLRPGTHRGVRTHQKLLIAHGHVGRRPDTIRVWTGSQNWTTRAAKRDDLVVRIDDQEVGRQYVRGFFRMWRRG